MSLSRAVHPQSSAGLAWPLSRRERPRAAVRHEAPLLHRRREQHAATLVLGYFDTRKRCCPAPLTCRARAAGRRACGPATDQWRRERRGLPRHGGARPGNCLALASQGWPVLWPHGQPCTPAALSVSTPIRSPVCLSACLPVCLSYGPALTLRFLWTASG